MRRTHGWFDWRLCFLALWIVAVGSGQWVLLNYDTAPGATSHVSSDWPEGSQLRRDAGRPQLLMFVHPRCPCSRASLGELAQLMGDCQGLVTAHVLFFTPLGGGE